MTTKRIVGLALIVIGIVALVWGGVFWTDRETVIDAGPLQVTADEREGVALPPILGVIALIGGIVLLVVPDRRRA
jgi:drug/metabolite transporter (DMT)-like permease